MARRIVLGSLRVQEITHQDGRVSWTIVRPDGVEHQAGDRFLRKYEGSGTQRTYAYLLVDHLRWLARENLDVDTVTFQHLQRYMGIVGADVKKPLGEPWRGESSPYMNASLALAAATLKGFYLNQASPGLNGQLREALEKQRLPSRADRNRSLLGHTKSKIAVNPLSPSGHRKHPKMLPNGAADQLLAVANSARDRMVITWLKHSGLRIGELCGLHLADLHLRENSDCGECVLPHIHIVHRKNNPNRASVKTKKEWSVGNKQVTGGLIKRASNAMIHTYFEYMTTEYPTGQRHGMLLTQLKGPNAGSPWAPAAARGMLKSASGRAGLDRIRPKMFRHSFASEILEASDGDAFLTSKAGGWASSEMVEKVYGHVDFHDPKFDAALRQVWGEQNEP